MRRYHGPCSLMKRDESTEYCGLALFAPICYPPPSDALCIIKKCKERIWCSRIPSLGPLRALTVEYALHVVQGIAEKYQGLRQRA